MIPIEQMKALLDYVPETGHFVWKVDRRRVRPGDIAGCVGHHGYRLIRLGGHLRHAHRWVWYWHTGEWLDSHIDLDHINGNRDDNRIENLRIASRCQNMWNGKTRADNKTGYPGVVKPKGRDKWDARIIVKGEFHFLGAFDTYEQAVAARQAAERVLHGEFRKQR